MQGLLIAMLMMGDTTGTMPNPMMAIGSTPFDVSIEGQQTPLTLELAEQYQGWCNGVAQRDTVRGGDCYGYFRIHHKPPILYGWYSIVGETPTFPGFIEWMKGRR